MRNRDSWEKEHRTRPSRRTNAADGSAECEEEDSDDESEEEDDLFDEGELGELDDGAKLVEGDEEEDDELDEEGHGGKELVVEEEDDDNEEEDELDEGADCDFFDAFFGAGASIGSARWSCVGSLQFGAQMITSHSTFDLEFRCDVNCRFIACSSFFVVVITSWVIACFKYLENVEKCESTSDLPWLSMKKCMNVSILVDRFASKEAGKSNRMLARKNLFLKWGPQSLQTWILLVLGKGSTTNWRMM